MVATEVEMEHKKCVEMEHKDYWKKIVNKIAEQKR